MLEAYCLTNSAASDPELEPYLGSALRNLAEAEAALEAGDHAEAAHRAYLAQLGVQIAERQREIDAAERDVMAAAGGGGRRFLLTDAFRSGRTDLRAGPRAAVSEVAEYLAAHPARVVLVEGFSDSTGDAGRNLDLSRRRAAAVEALLVREGVAPDRIVTEGYGELYPLASNDTAEGQRLNRRIEITIAGRLNDLPVR